MSKDNNSKKIPTVQEVGVCKQGRNFKGNFHKATASMLFGNSCKGNSKTVNQVETRSTRAKRRIDFKVFDKEGRKGLAMDDKNNAQIDDNHHPPSVKQRKKFDRSKNLTLSKAKQGKSLKISKSNPSKVKVLLQKEVMNSDEEELDYEDDISTQEDGIVDPDDDCGSMDEEISPQISTDSAILLSASSSTLNDEDVVMSNPHLKRLFDRMLEDRMKKARDVGESSNSKVLTTRTPPKNKSGKDIVKSPFDTTVYAPALQKRPGFQASEIVVNFIPTGGNSENITFSNEKWNSDSVQLRLNDAN